MIERNVANPSHHARYLKIARFPSFRNLRGRVRNMRETIGRWYSLLVHHRMTIGFPWYWPADRNETPEMRTIRRAARELIADERHPAVRLVAWMAAALTWPVGAAVHLTLVMRNTKEFTVADLHRYALDAYWVALRHNVWPAEYFSFELWRPENRANVDNYFYQHEIPRVLAALRSPAGETDPIEDKIEFNRFCRTHGLPCLPTLVVVRSETDLLSDLSGQDELWTKPARACSGIGGEPWLRDEDCFVSMEGDRLDRRGVLERLVNYTAIFGPMIVQPRARNSPVLDSLTNGYAAVFRLITCSDTDHRTTIVGAYVELPAGASCKSQGAPIAAVDIDGGSLKQVRKENMRSAILNADGIPLLIPHWHEACCAVLRGHDQLPCEALLGWDVVITPSGPVLLEVNRNVSTNEIQFAEGRPTFARRPAGQALAQRIAARSRQVA